MNRFSIHKLPSDVLREIAARHRAVRKSAGLSQEELAKRSGVSLGSIKRFETSGRVALESLLKLAHVLSRLDDFNSIFESDPLDSLENQFSDKTRR